MINQQIPAGPHLGGSYPLTDAQRGIWLRSKSNPRAGQAFQLPLALRLHGDLDKGALEAAIHDLLRWNDGLRSSFPVDENGNPFCRIGPASQARAEFQFIDLLGHLDAAEEVTALAEKDWRTPFDLENGPMVRASLVRESADCHTLILTTHHSVVDGPSLILVAEQLASLYNFRTGRAPAPVPAPSMADFAAREAAYRATGECCVPFWREALADARRLHGIPTDRPRPRIEDPTAGFIKFGFNREETALVRAGARKANVTLYTVLLASWAVLVARLGRDDHAVVGVPFSRHSHGDAASLVGCLIDLLPVKIPHSPTMEVSELLAITRTAVKQAVAHAALPLDQIMAAAGIPASPAHHPLFQTSISIPRQPVRVPDFVGLQVSAIGISVNRAMVDDGLDAEEAAIANYSCAVVAGTTTPSATKMDISIALLESAGRLHGGIEFSSALWDEATLRMMANCWRHVALSMSQCTEQRIADIGWHPNKRAPVCEALPVPSPREPEFLGQALRRWAKLNPDGDAIVLRGQRINFSRLNRLADDLADALRNAGARPGSRVAFVGSRGLNAVALMFASFRCGSTFVPLDEDMPNGRLAHILNDCDPSIVVGAPTELAAATSRVCLAAEIIDSPPYTGRPVNTEPLPELKDWRDLPAYIIYTSGSTGNPKGVEVGHEALALCGTTLASYCDSQPNDRVLQAASIGFDVFILEVVMSIGQGATLCIPHGSVLVGDTLGENIEELQVTHALLTPTAISSLKSSDFPNLRSLYSCAEPLGGDLARKWARGRRLFNCYGPTEATIIATAIEVPEEISGDPPIGYVLGQHAGYVLDPHGHPVPPGVIGELHLGGNALANGYVGSTLLTSERFIANPFNPEPGSRMYRTGDLVRALPDGALQFHGRNDSQVKIHGVRIEPQEVESCIASVPGVKAVHVRVIDVPAGRRLAAYVLASEDTDAALIKSQLKTKLPGYMVPAHIIMLAAFPLLPSGKLDHRAFPLPEADEGRQIAAARSATEGTLCSLWSDLLGIPRIGRDDHFFDLGGHSLLAVQVISRVRQNLGVDVALADLFAHPVLSDFAACIDGKDQDRLPPIEPVDRQALLPLSFAQQRLWFLAQLGEHASRAYHMPLGLQLRGPLDRPALQRALDRLVERHEALRTHFALQDGVPVQVIEPPAPFELHDHDLRNEADPAQAALALAADEADRPFDLERGPLIRGRLLCLADDHHHLLLTQHHILSDGWSLGVLTRELGALYDAFAQGRPDPLPPLPVQYADYAVWQRQHVSGERLQAQADYWRRQLADAPARLDLPTDRPRPAEQDFAGGMVSFELDAELTAALRRLGQRHGTTLFQTLLASWALLLSRLSGQEDLVIGTPTANRDHGQTQDLIGFFVNALPLRIDLGGDPTVAELLARTRATALDALAHHDIPFEQVVDLVGTERNLAHNPIFQVGFALQNAPAPPLRLAGLDISTLPRPPHRSAIFDLSVHLWEVEDRIDGLLEFATATFDQASIQRLIHRWRHLLAQLESADRAPADDLAIMGPGEEDEIAAWTTSRGQADPEDVVARIEAQARLQPEAIALRQSDHDLDYGSLLASADSLADALRSRGAGPGTRIALCLPRSFGLPIAMLAVLRAGAAYVPIDPRAPSARLEFFLDDCQPLVVLAEADLDLPGSWQSLDRLDPRQFTYCADSTDVQSERLSRSAVVPPGSVAYVIYTSGSTGQPKGVQISRGSLANLVAWHIERFSLAAGESTSALAGLAFDAFAWEVWPALAAGATLHLAGEAESRDPAALLAWWAATPLDVSFLPTPLAELAFREGPLNLHLRTLLVGGDKLHHVPAELPFELVNNYGPTETTVVATSGGVRPGGTIIDVGRPIANTRVEVLDRRRRRVPAGVVGEVYIGGAGVAAGYLGRPDLDADRFEGGVFSGESNGRLYRTGDLGRWLPGGLLDIRGRNDDQVKVRGFRIEPGEVAEHLKARPGVSDALVLPIGDDTERRLAAFVRADPSYDLTDAPQIAQEQVGHWAALYDDNYASATDADTTEDFTGWNSSFTGTPIPEDQMRAWRDETVERIRELGARRILEIGCGSGLLLFPLAPGAEHYVGTDLSSETIERLRRKTAAHGLAHVELHHREAIDFSGLGNDFDLVIINSVAQYFPSADYLREVLTLALGAVTATGCVFLGDLRHLGLLGTFHTAIQDARAEPELPQAQLAAIARTAADADKELLVDPAFLRGFATEQGISGGLRLLPKQGRHSNELTTYRFDAILHRYALPPLAKATTWHWREDGLDKNGLIERLAASRRQAYVLLGVDNSLLVRDYSLFHRVEAAGGQSPLLEARIRAAQKAADTSAITPVELLDVAAEQAYRVVLHWEGADAGQFHALLLPAEIFTDPLPAFPEQFIDQAAKPLLTNAPMRASIRARLREALTHALGDELPDYMQPAHLVVLDEFPLTANGKVDRRALEALARGSAGADYAAPVGTTESTLSTLWSDLLGIPRIGRDDHFFDLGGHSLLAVQVISRVRQNLGVDVALADLFAHPVLSDFAACIDGKDQDRLPPIEPVDRQALLPLSFAQQRLWFLAQLGEHASRAYHMPLGLQLRGPLDRPALQRALDRLVERHEALRTHFALQDGVPVQVIEPPAPFELHDHDLRNEADPAQAALALAADEADRPFDLERGPLIRGRLLCLADDHHHLLLTQHHILSDGWSLGVLTRELGALYDAFAQGRPDPLPPLPVQYADYAVWQRQHVSGERLQAQADYWRRQLADAPARLDLPTDRPRPAEQDFAGGMVSFELDAELTAALRRLGQRHGTTLFQTLLASWALLLSRLSGQEDLVIGTPTANRDHGQTQDLIGFFVNALPLRIDLGGDPTVAELLARTRATALDALAHHDIPFEQVVDLVGTERNLAHNPVFQVAFAWMEDPVGDAGFGQASATLLVPASPARSPFDLALSISPKNDRLFCDLSFARALFESTSAERFAALWQNLLSNMISRSGSRMSHIPLMGEAMLDEVKHFAKGPKKERADKHQLIHERAALHARTQPAALAVVQGAHSLSYEDLLDLASRFAKSLVGLGIKPGQIVGIQMSSRMEQPVAFLGCLMAGGVYFPIDRELPEDRISFMIADAKPALVVVAAGEFASPGCASIPQVTLDLDELRRSTESGVFIPDLHDDADGYLIYTSGSTGTPKGVAIRHKAVLATVADNADLFNVHPGSRILQVAPIGFDMSVFDLVLSLCCGGTLCLPSGGQKLIGDQLAKEIHGSRASHICMTPSVLSTLADTDQLASLTTITLAGEPLPGSLSRYWARHRRVLNAYGPTEAAIASTCYLCSANEMEDPPIGRPLANVNCHVLDSHGAPVPIGVSGELHIGGAGVAQGYRDRPGLTAERFIPDPWSTQPGALLFKSGDIVKWRADGNLCFVGRNDGQVKLRGFRIELGEVESRLATHPLVTEAVVVLREDAAREKQIVAYLVAAPGHEQEEEVPKKLRSYLADFLPEYMIPGAFVVLQQMPLTANGKLAHDRLPEPDSIAFALAGFEAPEGELENLIADSWMDVLGRRGVGRHDNFFHLGGHSLLLFRVSARLSSAGVTVPLPDMFRYPTISGLAAHITGGLLGKGQIAAERLTEGLGGPVFAFHDGSGMLAYARQLAEAFGQGAPAFYGLPSCPVGEIQPDTMAAMAERMLGLILDLQPRGPYRLVGWSFGGLLAYETAIQLKRRGHRIEFLGMLDSHLLANLMPPELISEEKAHLLTQMQTEAFGNPRLQARLEDLRKGVDDMSLQELVEAARAAIRDPLIFPWLRGMPESEAAAYLRRQQALHHAAMSWLPTEAIEAVLFTATGSARRADKSWKDSLAANALVVAEVAGDHHSMLQPPFLEGLALKIESWLSRSEAPR